MFFQVYDSQFSVFGVSMNALLSIFENDDFFVIETPQCYSIKKVFKNMNAYENGQPNVHLLYICGLLVK